MNTLDLKVITPMTYKPVLRALFMKVQNENFVSFRRILRRSQESYWITMMDNHPQVYLQELRVRRTQANRSKETDFRECGVVSRRTAFKGVYFIEGKFCIKT